MRHLFINRTFLVSAFKILAISLLFFFYGGATKRQVVQLANFLDFSSVPIYINGKFMCKTPPPSTGVLVVKEEGGERENSTMSLFYLSQILQR